MEFHLFLIVVVIVLLVIVFSARNGLRGGGGSRAEPRRQCPGCMTSLPAHARFCARCGRKQG